jgi:hypothetical protein
MPLDHGYKLCNIKAMTLIEWLSSSEKTQADLAEIIKQDATVEQRDKVRAHRIYHGAIPNEYEMPRIYAASGGKVTANDFYKLPPPAQVNGRGKNEKGAH